MTAANQRRDAHRTPAAVSAARQSEADRTVRITNLVPSTEALIELDVRNLLRAHRIGGILRVGVPLDAPRDRDGKNLNVPRERWTASRAFAVFNSVERAERAAAAFDGLAHAGSILTARRQGGATRSKATTSASTAAAPAELQPLDFPELSSGQQAPAQVQEWPRPGPQLVLPVPEPVLLEPSEDAASTVAPSDELSAATTTAPRCKYCKAFGHVARSRGAICCPVLQDRVEREEAARMAKVQLSKASKALRKYEDELTGWTRVGKVED
uniref:Uncharacterized protein n=1 Tax=Haptolina brevifila TaxID=156173 RepID=A0A7S2DQU0_9EUKA